MFYDIYLLIDIQVVQVIQPTIIIVIILRSNLWLLVNG